MRKILTGMNVLLAAAAGLIVSAGPGLFAGPSQNPELKHRWLFVWRDMTNAQEVRRVIERLPRAKAAGYNAVVLSYNVAPSMAEELRLAAKQNGMDIVAIVMGGAHDRNYMEGVPVEDALFVVRDGRATLAQDNPTKVVNGDFEDFTGNRFSGWAWQDDEGITTFVDHEIKHSGRASLRMENIGKNQYRHCRIMQSIKLQPFRQYHVSVWILT